MNILNHFRSFLSKYVVIGAAMAIIMPASPVLAVDDTSAVAADNTSSQAASTGATDTAPTPDPVIPPVVIDAPPTPETEAPTVTTPTDEVPAPAPESPVCPVTPVDPLVQGNPDASTTTNAVVNNCLNSDAISGDASVVGNNTAGDATSGNADVQATLLNLLQSISNLGGGGLSTFMQNVYGDTNGDLHIDPSVLGTLLGGCGACNTNVNSSATAQINNDLNLNATSGDATVADNRRAGDALTGNASVIANLINIINSIANSGQSFLGTINIYGNLNGNILLPAGWLDGLLGGGSAPPPDDGQGGEILDTTSVSGINNNINQNSTSGDAMVEGNRRAGDAITGSAQNTLNIINLANRQIVGGNVLLVFVNVLGTWYGVIMDAPAGQNTAVLGGDITQNGACNCGLSGDINTNSQINNNINMTATTGDASVTGNRRAGNATSGDASTNLNLANIINSQISLSNWFGVLFINVFGTWNGSLAEEPAIATPSGGSGTPQIFSVTPSSTGGSTGNSYQYRQASVLDDNTDDSDQGDDNTLGATTDGGGSGPTIKASWLNKAIIAGISSCACFFLMGLIGRRRKTKIVESLPEVIFPTI